MLHCKFNLSLHDLDPKLHGVWDGKAKHTYLQQYFLWALVGLREKSLRERNAPMTVHCRSLHRSSGQKQTLLLLCVCTVLSPVGRWSIVWTLRSYFHAADYWDNHFNNSLGAVQEKYHIRWAVPSLQRLPALAGAAAVDARDLAFSVNTQLHAVKLCSPLEGKTRHRLIKQECLNRIFKLSSSVIRPGIQAEGCDSTFSL